VTDLELHRINVIGNAGMEDGLTQHTGNETLCESIASSWSHKCCCCQKRYWTWWYCWKVL